MPETSERIEQDVFRKREQLGRDLDELQYKVKRAVDWRAQVEDRPFTMMAIAVAGGALAAALFGNTRVSRRIRRGSAHQWEKGKGRVEHSARRAASAWGDKVADTWDNLTDAVAKIAATTFAEYLSELLPGVRERYHDERTGKRGQYAASERPSSRDASWQRTPDSREAGYARQSS